MYSDKKNILQLVALLEAHGITKVVLCPGSRNAPLVHTLSTHPGFTCYAMTDERSAGYFAMGLALHGILLPFVVLPVRRCSIFILLWQKRTIRIFL